MLNHNFSTKRGVVPFDPFPLKGKEEISWSMLTIFLLIAVIRQSLLCSYNFPMMQDSELKISVNFRKRHEEIPTVC